MDQNPSASPQASTHEQAFIPTLVSDKLDAEFWVGGRRPRHDGWSPAKLREFIVRLSQCGVVADAAKFVGMSAQSAYAYRNRAEGRAFHLAWEAALVHAHRRLADELLSRAMNGVVERTERNGVVTERHRYDSRLSMAVLTRLDRVTAEARKEGSAVHAVAEELDQFLDIIGGAEPAPPEPQPEDSANAAADRFLAARRLDAADRAEVSNFVGESRPAYEEVLLARLDTYRRCRAGLPAEIDTSDLDPDAMESWTDDQIARADSSGFLRGLEEEEWPRTIAEAALEAAVPAGTDAGGEGVEAPAEESLGMLHLHQLYLDLHAPEEEEEDEPVAYEVWQKDNGEWRTNFPPPRDFDPFDEDGEFGDDDYSRRLTAAERDAIPNKPLDCEIRARERARAEVERDEWFARSAAGVTTPWTPSIIDSGAAPPPDGNASMV